MEASEQTFTVKLANQLDELENIRVILKKLLADWAIPPSVEFPLNVALEEVFTNVVKYAFTDGKDHEIELKFKNLGDRLELTLSDDGLPYDPTIKPEPDTTLQAKDRPVGGLGVFLVKKVMDKVEYQRVNDKNHLILTKNLEK
jgi:anti-sigma regulatory factor (Ser/Thr protein kinase)